MPPRTLDALAYDLVASYKLLEDMVHHLEDPQDHPNPEMIKTAIWTVQAWLGRHVRMPMRDSPETARRRARASELGAAESGAAESARDSPETARRRARASELMAAVSGAAESGAAESGAASYSARHSGAASSSARRSHPY